MVYGLEEFCGDCQSALAGGDGDGTREGIRQNLEKLLENKAFVAEHCGDDAESGVHTLHHDPALGFMVLAHINTQGRKSPPHDHGESWAIYGQAVGHTDMTEYDRTDDQNEAGKANVEQTNEYRLTPGMAGTFGPRRIHSINFTDGARFIRVTGTDLSQLSTRRFDMSEGTVNEVEPNTAQVSAGTTG